MPDLTTPMITNIKLPNSIKSPLYVSTTIGCSRDIQPLKLDQRMFNVNVNYSPKSRSFEVFCPYCEAKATITVQAIICLIDNPEHVVSSNGHWFIINGNLYATMTVYLELIAKIPFYEPEPLPKPSFFMALINWFK